MPEWIHEAGWPIYMVIVVGAASLTAAMQYARSPRRDLFALVVGLGVATALLGVIGTVLGIQMSAGAIGKVAADQRWIFLVGLKESLHNTTAALVIAAVDALVVTVGAVRFARREARRDARTDAATAAAAATAAEG